MNPRERFVAECIGALVLAGIYIGAEFCWDLRGCELTAGRAGMTLAACGLSWIVVRATIPHWPVERRLVLCLALCAAANVVAEVRVRENLSRFGTVHTGSDDSFYLKSGRQFGALLGDADTMESYANVYASLPYTPHVGFIVVLGHLFSLVPSDELSELRAVVLLNLFALHWLSALVIRLGAFPARQLRLVLFLLFVPGFDLFYFASAINKDVAIVVLLVALTGALLNLAGDGVTVRLLAAIAFLATALFFLRNFYAVLPPLAMLLTRLRAQKGGLMRRLLVRCGALLGLALVLILVIDSVWFQSISLEAAWRMKLEERGWGAQIYNVPIAGPLLYALITPLPPRWADIVAGWAWSDSMRSAGVIAMLALMAATLAAGVRTQTTTDKRWDTFLHLGAIVFLLGAYGSLEARHHMGTVPCVIICYGMSRQRCAAGQLDPGPGYLLPRVHPGGVQLAPFHPS